MKTIRLLTTGAMLVAGAAMAADDYELVRDRLSGMIGEDSAITIAETPLEGLLQVRVGSDIVYMSDDGRYLVQGRVLDLETQTDLTDAARASMRRESLNGLDSSEWVRFGADNPEHEILVFTDPDCGYCRRLHQQIAEYNAAGIRVNYMAFPRAGIGSGTYDKLVSIWCAEDQQGAMDIAKAGGTPEPVKCDSPVEEHYRLGQALGVTGTPALMTLNGDLIPGYVPPDQLRQRLDQLKAQ